MKEAQSDIERVSITKGDIIAAAIAGELIAWLFFVMAKVNAPELPLPEGLVKAVTSPWLLAVSFPVLSVAGLWLVSFFARKIKTLYQAARFALVGTLNTFVDFGVLNLLILTTGLAAGAAFAVFKGISFLVAVTNSYFWNKFWTFESGKSHKKGEFFQFFAISAIGLVLNVSVAVFVVNVIGPQAGLAEGVWANVGALIATLAVLTWNFAGYKFLVFKK
jgi:putative flippase GtrA